MVAALALGL